MPTIYSRQQGYVLLLTLVMVALVVAGTVGLTRTSLARATEAKRAERDLQRRWATISCRRVLLERAPQLFEQRWQDAIEANNTDADTSWVQPDRRSMRVVTRQITLGDLTIDVRLADEQAKLNVNALLSESEPRETSGLVDTLVSTSPGYRFTVDLKPTAYDDSSEQRVHTLERIFKGFDPGLLFNNLRTNNEDLSIDAVTCWGDGKLRLALASDEALRLLLSPHMDSTRLEHLLELRDERPDITVDRAMRALALGPSQSGPVRRLLTDKSTCYSLWLTVRSKQRTSYRLDIFQTQGDSQQRNMTYLW